MNKVALNFCVQVFILGKCLEIGRLYIKYLFNFMRKYQIVFQNDYTILHSYRQYKRVPPIHTSSLTCYFSRN